MIGLRDPVDQMAAVLHDVVEDTDVELRELLEAGFPDAVVAAVDSLTHRPNESFDHYIERLAHNDVARRVKIVDLKENLANNLRPPSTTGNAERIARYEKALARLSAGGDQLQDRRHWWSEGLSLGPPACPQVGRFGRRNEHGRIRRGRFRAFEQEGRDANDSY